MNRTGGALISATDMAGLRSRLKSAQFWIHSTTHAGNGLHTSLTSETKQQDFHGFCGQS